MQQSIGSAMVSSLLGYFSPLWSSLPSSVLPASFNLPSFLPSKDRSSTTLGTRWHDFFLLPFLNISPFYFIFFILFIAFLFFFLRDADSRKATLCPSCVPIHRKKKKRKISKISKLYSECDSFSSPFVV